MPKHVPEFVHYGTQNIVKLSDVIYIDSDTDRINFYSINITDSDQSLIPFTHWYIPYESKRAIVLSRLKAKISIDMK